MVYQPCWCGVRVGLGCGKSKASTGTSLAARWGDEVAFACGVLETRPCSLPPCSPVPPRRGPMLSSAQQRTRDQQRIGQPRSLAYVVGMEGARQTTMMCAMVAAGDPGE